MARDQLQALFAHERRRRRAPMIEFLSPREYDEVTQGETKGLGWARVIRLFLDGPRLLLGWDLARSDEEIARLAGLEDAATRAAIEEAVRWAVAHRLHLLGWQEEDGGRRYFMAVG